MARLQSSNPHLFHFNHRSPLYHIGRSNARRRKKTVAFYLGSVGEISREPELKVEVMVRAERVDETIAAVKRIRPYEESVINAISLWRISF